MEGWKTDKIENLFFLGRGRVINDEDIKEHPGVYPVYSSQTSNNGEFGKVDFYEFEGEYITWTTDGANAGKVFYRSGKFNCTNVCGTLKPKNPEKTDVKFFSYLIDRHAFRHVAVVGNNKLMNNVMGKIKITFPTNVHHQSAIAAILSKVDEAIASVQASISAAERLKKSLMQNLLTGRMKPDGTLRTEDEFYVDEKFGKVPKGWGVKKIAEISDYVQYGLNQASSENGKTPMLRMNNIVKGKMTNAPLVYVELNDSLLQQYKLEKGDILFNRTNSLDLVGKVGIFELKGDYVFASYLIKVKISKNNNPYFVNYALNSYPIQCSLRSKATPAVSQANINSKSLRNTTIIIPTNKEEQDEIVKKILVFEKQNNYLYNKISILERLKKSLMQNLLTGRVRV